MEAQGNAMAVKERQKVKETQWKANERQCKVKGRQWKVKERQCRTR